MGGRWVIGPILGLGIVINVALSTIYKVQDRAGSKLESNRYLTRLYFNFAAMFSNSDHKSTQCAGAISRDGRHHTATTIASSWSHANRVALAHDYYYVHYLNLPPFPVAKLDAGTEQRVRHDAGPVVLQDNAFPVPEETGKPQTLPRRVPAQSIPVDIHHDNYDRQTGVSCITSSSSWSPTNELYDPDKLSQATYDANLLPSLHLESGHAISGRKYHSRKSSNVLPESEVERILKGKLVSMETVSKEEEHHERPATISVQSDYEPDADIEYSSYDSTLLSPLHLPTHGSASERRHQGHTARASSGTLRHSEIRRIRDNITQRFTKESTRNRTEPRSDEPIHFPSLSHIHSDSSALCFLKEQPVPETKVHSHSSYNADLQPPLLYVPELPEKNDDAKGRDSARHSFQNWARNYKTEIDGSNARAGVRGSSCMLTASSKHSSFGSIVETTTMGHVDTSSSSKPSNSRSGSTSSLSSRGPDATIALTMSETTPPPLNKALSDIQEESECDKFSIQHSEYLYPSTGPMSLSTTSTLPGISNTDRYQTAPKVANLQSALSSSVTLAPPPPEPSEVSSKSTQPKIKAKSLPDTGLRVRNINDDDIIPVDRRSFEDVGKTTGRSVLVDVKKGDFLFCQHKFWDGRANTMRTIWVLGKCLYLGPKNSENAHWILHIDGPHKGKNFPNAGPFEKYDTSRVNI